MTRAPIAADPLAVHASIRAGERLPLEIMIEAMRCLHRKAIEAEATGKPVAIGAGKSVDALSLRMMAVDVAAKAAPYVHPKLANVGTPKDPVDGYEAWLMALGADTVGAEANEP